MSGLQTHRRERNIARDRREGARLLPTEGSRCPLCARFLAKNWSPLTRLSAPVSIGGVPCRYVHEHCAERHADVRAAVVRQARAANPMIDERGRCKRHPDAPVSWCLECTDAEIDRKVEEGRNEDVEAWARGET